MPAPLRRPRALRPRRSRAARLDRAWRGGGGRPAPIFSSPRRARTRRPACLWSSASSPSRPTSERARPHAAARARRRRPHRLRRSASRPPPRQPSEPATSPARSADERAPAARRSELRSRRVVAFAAGRQRPARRPDPDSPRACGPMACSSPRSTGGDTLNELRQSLTAAESEILSGAAPRVAPFVDVRALGGLLQRAGFALPVVDLDRAVVRYGDIIGLMRDLRALGAPMRSSPAAGAVAARRAAARRRNLRRAFRRCRRAPARDLRPRLAVRLGAP